LTDKKLYKKLWELKNREHGEDQRYRQLKMQIESTYS
jgi:steroid 5-alpha reductase family enzyme